MSKKNSFTFDDDTRPLKSKILEISTHLVAWIIFLALLIYLVPKSGHINSFAFLLFPNLLFIGFFYLNYYFLVPRFFIQHRYFVYALVCVLALVVTTGLPSVFSVLTALIRSFTKCHRRCRAILKILIFSIIGTWNQNQMRFT